MSDVLLFGLRRIWGLIVVASLVAVGSGAFVLRRSAATMLVPCDGDLVVAAPPIVSAGAAPPIVSAGAAPSRALQATDLVMLSGPPRLAWVRPGDKVACSELAMPFDGLGGARARMKELDNGTVLIEPTDGDTHRHRQIVVQATERQGHRFVPARFEWSQQAPALVVLVAVLALVVASLRALRAAAYPWRLDGWLEASLRPDGAVETPAGMLLGRTEPNVRVRPGAVLVRPESKSDVYRAVRLIARGEIAAGGHRIWQAATRRRLRDARALATLALLAAAAAGVACLVA